MPAKIRDIATMKLYYAIMAVFILLASACAQQTQPTAELITDDAVQEPQEQAQEQAQEQETEDQASVSTNEVRIVGKSLDPLEISIAAGESITWFNDLDKGTTLTIMKDGKHYLNSPLITKGGQWELEFTEAGEYEYWTLAFGPQGAKITVT